MLERQREGIAKAKAKAKEDDSEKDGEKEEEDGEKEEQVTLETKKDNWLDDMFWGGGESREGD